MATTRPRRSTAAKKRAPAAKKAAITSERVLGSTEDTATRGLTDEVEVGDAVVVDGIDGANLGVGRLCGLFSASRMAKVNFGGAIGCREVARASLRAAPAGSSAPNCDDC